MRVPILSIPALVLAALVAGYSLRTQFTQATLTQTFAEGAGVQTRFVVEGLRCKGTALFLASLYEEVPGVLGLEVYATERTAIFKHDPQRLPAARIKEIMEAPIPFEDGTTTRVFRCESIR